MAIMGDTVRLTATFYNFNDVLEDPSEVTVKIYDQNKSQIGETILLTFDDNRESTGIWFYDYVIPDGYKKIYYEFCGVIDGKPSVERDIILITFS